MEREEIEDMGHGVRLVEDDDGDTALEVDGEIVRIASERDAARRERDELSAQLAALREACRGVPGHASIHEVLSDAAPAVEAYTRRVQADALESAADDVCDHEQLAEGRTLAAERSSLQRWLRARAAEIRGGR